MNNPTESISSAVPPFTNLTRESIKQLDALFESASPLKLRESVLEIYHVYLIHNHDILPIDFDSISLNIYHLIQCLKEVGEEMQVHGK